MTNGHGRPYPYRLTGEGDDLLGDAYEYLMRHFATESGKSKGQFYTPAEVSRVMAKVVGVRSEFPFVSLITCARRCLTRESAASAPIAENRP